MDNDIHSGRLTPEDEKIWRRVCIFGFHLKSIGHEVCAEKAATLSDILDRKIMHSLTHHSMGCSMCIAMLGHEATGDIAEFKLRHFQPKIGDGTLAGLLLEMRNERKL